MRLPILSEEAFKAIDRLVKHDMNELFFPHKVSCRNKDGYISLGELKLANKERPIRAIAEVNTHELYQMID